MLEFRNLRKIVKDGGARSHDRGDHRHPERGQNPALHRLVGALQDAQTIRKVEAKYGSKRRI